MKSFCGSVILFTILILAVTLNGIYILDLSERIGQYAERLERVEKEEDPTALLEELQDLWKQNRKYLAFSIDTETLDDIEKTILSLIVAYESGDSYEFEKYRAYLGEAAREISRFERLDIETIF
jgi:hypothetical protein